MAREMGAWFFEDVWKRAVASRVWALVREHNGRYEVATCATGTYSKWEDYCPTMDAAGGRVCQEHKAKRRATALAKRILKGFK